MSLKLNPAATAAPPTASGRNEEVGVGAVPTVVGRGITSSGSATGLTRGATSLEAIN